MNACLLDFSILDKIKMFVKHSDIGGCDNLQIYHWLKAKCDFWHTFSGITGDKTSGGYTMIQIMQ